MKKRIFITQRDEFFADTNEYRDCLDQNFYNLFCDDLWLLPISNTIHNIQMLCDDLKVEGFILSGGNSILPQTPGYSRSRNILETEILNYAASHSLPVIGICRGFQMMNHYLGGGLKHLNCHVGNNHDINLSINNKVIHFEVNSYHHFGISSEQLTNFLIPTAISFDGSIELAYHLELPWLGMMWHPERPIKNQELWIKLIKKIFDYPSKSIKQHLIDTFNEK